MIVLYGYCVKKPQFEFLFHLSCPLDTVKRKGHTGRNLLLEQTEGWVSSLSKVYGCSVSPSSLKVDRVIHQAHKTESSSSTVCLCW